jgi:GTP-binding protein
MEEGQTHNSGSSVIPIVAIVGRPNVGKSTLFNRLCRDRRAIVDDSPGITRDRLIAQVTWGDRSFCLVDTGGIEEEAGQPTLKIQVRQQAQMAVEEADLVIFLADGKEGLHSGDAAVVDLLRRSGKPVLYGVNKIDGPEQESAIYEFYSLGVEKFFPISAAHGYGIRAMLDTMVEMLPPEESAEQEVTKGIRVAIIGRPNVGKSSLINRLLGAERVLVSDLPGTTRDAIDVSVTLNDEQYVLIDTPGIRRRSKTREKIEKFSVLKALKSIDRCQVAVLLLDGSEGITSQDVRIAGYIHDRGRGAVVVINKWDLVHRDPKRVAAITESVDDALKFMPYAPQLRISALTGKRVSTLLPTLNKVFSQYSTRVQTSAVNDALAAAVSRHEPPMHGGRRTKILYGVQVTSQPPTFVLFVSYPEAIHFSYRRYLTNQIRKAFSLDLTPVRLIFRGRENGKGKGRRRRG